jgi:hypothetical protein
MKMYYINNGNENGGPFTLEELKQQVVVQPWFGNKEWKIGNMRLMLQN